MTLRSSGVTCLATVCALLVTVLFAGNANASPVDNWNACGGACLWEVDWGLQSAAYFSTGASVLLSDGTRADDGYFLGTYDSSGDFTYDTGFGTVNTQFVTVYDHSGTAISIGSNTLQAAFTTGSTPTGTLNAATGALDFAMTLEIDFQTVPTNKLKLGCHIDVSVTLSTANTWNSSYYGYPQSASNYSSSNGDSKILDDAETAPSATTSSCGTMYTTNLNTQLGLGTAGFGVYWTDTISAYYMGSTIYPTGS